MRVIFTTAAAGLAGLGLCLTLSTGLLAAEGNKPTTAVGSNWDAKVAAQPGGAISGATFDEAQIALITKIDGYFNNLDNLSGTFVQTGADNKQMKGRFYLKRPGRFRFDYNRPSRMVVISDGQYLAVQDHDINTDDRYALDKTPFRIILRKEVNILRDAKITEVQESNDIAIIALQDKNPNIPGSIKLFLTKGPEFALKEWITTDAQGLKTRVEVSSLDRTANIDSKLFKPKAISLPKF